MGSYRQISRELELQLLLLDAIGRVVLLLLLIVATSVGFVVDVVVVVVVIPLGGGGIEGIVVI